MSVAAGQQGPPVRFQVGRVPAPYGPEARALGKSRAAEIASTAATPHCQVTELFHAAAGSRISQGLDPVPGRVRTRAFSRRSALVLGAFCTTRSWKFSGLPAGCPATGRDGPAPGGAGVFGSRFLTLGRLSQRHPETDAASAEIDVIPALTSPRWPIGLSGWRDQMTKPGELDLCVWGFCSR